MQGDPKALSGQKPVGIWIRVSSEDQAKGESPEHHEQRARFYASSKGWGVKQVYHLEGVSGKSVVEHPESVRMLEDVRSGKIQALIFSKLARLARNTKELLDFADIFKTHNADLVSLQESIDTTTPAGRLFYTMIAAMAQWEREEIAERVKAGFAIRAKLGKPLNGKAPFGYQYVDRELVPHPEEAPIRKRMYEIFLETRRIRTTAKRLNDAGHRTHDGGLFTYSTVKRLLKNPTAKGVQIVNFSKNVSRGKTWQLKPKEEWVERPVEAIISTEMWEAANQILEDRKDTLKRPGKRPFALFSGLLFCHCGQRMYPRSNMPKYVCSRCWNKILIEDMDAIFLEQLKGFFLSRADIESHLAKSDEALTEKESHLKVHESELAKVRAEIDRTYRLYLDQKIDGDGFHRFYTPLQERRKQLEAELPRLQAELDVLKINNISSEEVLAEAQNLYARWPDFPFEDKRKIVESLTEKIVIGKTDVEITLCHLPSYETVTNKHRMLCDAASETDGA